MKAISSILFCVLMFTIPQARGLKCYSCTNTYTDGLEDPDLTCVNNPSAVPGKFYITCPTRMKYCVIVRNDYKGSGAVSSIYRNCAETPVILNDDVEDDELFSHYRSCVTDLCNSGSGIEMNDNGNGGNGGGGMIIPGRNAASLTSASVTLLLAITLSSYVLITKF